VERLRTDDLARFVQVVDSGGFSAAASVLGETPKQVSRRVAQLEADLGVRLLHRTTRRVGLTPEGQRYCALARGFGEQLAQVRDDLQEGDALRGMLRVRVITMLADACTEWLGQVWQEHPELSVEMQVGDGADDLVQAGVDVAITARVPTAAGTHVRRLGTVRPQLAAHVQYLKRAGTPRVPEDLTDHRCLRFAQQTEWTLHHEQLGERTVPVGDRFSCDDSRALQRAMVQGLGVGLHIQPSPDLVPVLPGWSFQTTPLYALIAPGRRQLRRVRLLLDAVPGIAARSFGVAWAE
jgi:DNA-binding transcriptional LysR family regulator